MTGAFTLSIYVQSTGNMIGMISDHKFSRDAASVRCDNQVRRAINVAYLTMGVLPWHLELNLFFLLSFFFFSFHNFTEKWMLAPDHEAKAFHTCPDRHIRSCGIFISRLF